MRFSVRLPGLVCKPEFLRIVSCVSNSQLVHVRNTLYRLDFYRPMGRVSDKKTILSGRLSIEKSVSYHSPFLKVCIGFWVGAIGK